MSVETPTEGAEQTILLYAPRRKLYPREIKGVFNSWRWTLVWATQSLYYGLPWLTWEDRPAILFNLVERKFFIFGLVLWPQDFIYLTALLVTSAFGLFLFTAVAGRLFCGYACPQTVYTEIFMKIEHWIEGNRAKRIRLDTRGPVAERLWRRTLTISAWSIISLWTGFTFAGYFTPIRELTVSTLAGDLGGWQSFWILFYSAFTLMQAGFMREQVCKYMCPYARFQSVMFDRDTLIVTYDETRGEPRGSRPRRADHRTLGMGDCIDCGICVEVCPTGIDIRRGLQYECIGCGLCSDGCNSIMDKMGYPRGLIRYSTQNAVANGYNALELRSHILRPRVLIYSVILTIVVLLLIVSLSVRSPLKVDIMHDRGTLAREVDGMFIENTYRFQLINTDEQSHRVRLIPSGLPGLEISSDDTIELPGISTQLLIVRMRSGIAELQNKPAGAHKIQVYVESISHPGVAINDRATFFIPR
jgi:cytochrome c oxidase accessory protein FixG